MHKNRYYLIPLLLLLCLAGPSQAAWSEADLLQPDQAFQISGHADGSDKLIVQWRVADGYYMYRDKIHFDTDSMGIELGQPVLPEAEIKHDEFFGDVPIYRGEVTALCRRFPVYSE